MTNPRMVFTLAFLFFVPFMCGFALGTLVGS